jgi:preprotein translocase subunit SecB
MKPKISPTDYRNILEALELSTLFVTELTSKLKEENATESLRLNIDEGNSFVQEGNLLKIVYSYKFNAKDDAKDDAAILINVKYTVVYTLTKEVQVTKDFMKVFSDLTLGMLLWPYFRELINNTIYRMGYPQLVLPLRKK